jgi:hypothetical protein
VGVHLRAGQALPPDARPGATIERFREISTDFVKGRLASVRENSESLAREN